jgi:hypothetical protein
MFSRIGLTMLTLSVFSLAATRPAGAPSADDIIRKSLAAQGGERAVRALTDVVMKGTIRNGGVVGSFSIFAKSPDMYRVDIEIAGQRFVEGFDGRIAWQSTRGKTRRLSGSEAAFIRQEARDVNGMLIGYKRRGIRAQLAGTSKLEGKPVLVVNWTYPNGTSKKLFFDSSTFLLLGEQRYRVPASGKKTLEITIYSDFRPVNGVLTPFKFKVVNGYGKSDLWVREVHNNTSVSASLFQMPA